MRFTTIKVYRCRRVLIVCILLYHEGVGVNVHFCREIILVVVISRFRCGKVTSERERC